MSPPQRNKTAFQFYQAECLSAIRNELTAQAEAEAAAAAAASTDKAAAAGPVAVTMGQAMGELSRRWKSLGEEEKQPFMEKEQQDKERYLEECREADRLAIQELERKRQAQQDTSGQRHARKHVDDERAQRLAKKQERDDREDSSDDEEKKRLKQQKKQETIERRKARQAQEDAVLARHRKLDKQTSKQANQRLDYLLKQSSIFAKLKMGSGSSGTGSAPSSPTSKNNYHSHHREEHESAQNSDDEEAEHVFLTKQPSCIMHGTLKPYQLEGLNWMIHLSEKGLNGILADEMGLGKTLQSISILAYQYEFQQVQGPHLICVPKSTLSNWMNELARWCPSLRAMRFHGTKEEREEIMATQMTHAAAAHDGKRPSKRFFNKTTQRWEDDNSDNPRQWDVCVTTYEVCNLHRKTLQKFAWKYLVIDEAHRLKNEVSMFSKTVRSFHTQHRLLLTGTPLQNNLHELWALLNFLLPDIFSSSDQFDEWFDLEIDDEDAKKNMISQLHKILKPFMIRRLKADVAKGLPPKTETLVMVGMSKMQKQLYKRLLLRDIDSITKSGAKNKTTILNIVMQLRKCCGHPYLFEGMEDRTLDPLGEHLVENCGKLTMVDKLLKKLKERGNRVLMFTQMTRVLDILEDFMVMRGYQYCRIDGNTDYETREASIDEFNREGTEKFCFLLSTRAGGLGINLQTADTCILYDSDWNPQADLQAQDRCHRLGQKKEVNIYRLVSENTVEEKIVERAQQKLKLDAMVVQQGRLKDKDKVSKEEMMAAIRFGADTVFRSEESTITDDDIDVILERGKAKTKELREKMKKAEKGDLLDFRLDAGMSAQTFEGIDYSDRELRDQLRLLAADSLGKRERRPPPTSYNPIMQPKKSMVVNNRRVKLPKSLRLPRMEDHHFYNRERLLELGNHEFIMYGKLRELGQLPSREYMEKTKTILPPELAEEKLELLAEGFGDWTKSMYFHFVKAAAKYGRDDIPSIAADMDMPEDTVAPYSAAFWKYGQSELKKDEWERVKASIERGEKKIAKRRKLTSLLSTFIGTFDKPREEIVFANKGTTHFALEQDRALLCAVNQHGYGNWDSVREEVRNDDALKFQHMVQGMNTDMIAKRCDYRMRQMEKEYEAREKVLKNQKPASVEAAESAIAAIKEIEEFDLEAQMLQLRGEDPPPLDTVSSEAAKLIEEHRKEQMPFIERLREIEIQVRGCMVLAEDTREAIMRGDQYVNYSNITLKGGGPSNTDNGDSGPAKITKEVEAKINPGILAVPHCGVCPSCRDPSSRRLCASRLEVRNKLIAQEEKCLREANKSSKVKAKKRKADDGPASPKKPPVKKKKKVMVKMANGQVVHRVTSQGNKRMSIPEELFPEFCRLIGAHGTGERMKLINDFVEENQSVSVRQVTMKFAEVSTKTRPECIPEPEKKSGRAFMFFLRPRFYHLLPEDERPDRWEFYKAEDEALWKKEEEERKRAKELKAQELKEKKEAEKQAAAEGAGDTVEAVAVAEAD